MSAAPDPIRVVLDGVEHCFENLDALVERTQRSAMEVQDQWRNRGSEIKPAVALDWLIQNAEGVIALTEAGLRRIDQEIAEAEKALAEIDRLVGEL